MRPFLLVFLLVLCYSCLGQEVARVVRSDLQVSNRRGMLMPPEAGLVSVLSKSAGKLSLELCLVDHELDVVIDRGLSDGFSIRSLECRLGETSPVVFYLTLEKPGLSVDDERIAGDLMLMRPSKPLEEGMKRTGSKPQIDWKAVSDRLGAEIRPDATGTAAFALPGMQGAFYGCSCGETILMGRLSCSPDELNVKIRALRKVGLHLTSVTMDGRVSFQAEGEAVDLARRVADAAKS